MGSKKISVPVGFGQTRTGSRRTRVIVEDGGLAVTEGVRCEKGLYTITHVDTGRRMNGLAYDAPAAAERALRRLLAAGDWTRPESQIIADATCRAAVDAELVAIRNEPCADCGHARIDHLDYQVGICIGCPCDGWESRAALDGKEPDRGA